MIFKDTKISSIVLLGLLCGIFLPIIVTYVFFTNNYKERSVQTMNIITDTIKISATEALWFFSDDWIRIVVKSAVKNEKVYSATIYNSENIKIAHEQEKNSISNMQTVEVDLEKNVEFLGKLTIVFNMDEINKDIYIEKSNLLWILLCQALISSLILYFIIKHKVLNPIKKLIYQSDLLSNKKLNEKFHWEQKDEMGRLGSAMNKTRISLKKMFKQLEDKVIYDNLTKAYNRNGFESIYDEEIKRCLRDKHPFSMIMFDIDFFKKVNDIHGHLVGDEILISICNLIRDNIRETDYLVRWGGEEFLIFTPEMDLNSALKLAEELRCTIDEKKFDDVGHVTISLAVAQKNEAETNEVFLKRVDDLLYNSKNSGRNKISF